MRFFVDEDLSPALVAECHKAGYDATCGRDRGMLGASDRAVAELCMDEDRILVTNNASDFLVLAEESGLHPGLIVMPLATRSEERVWMTVVIRSIEEEATAASQEAAAMMVNRLVEIDEAAQCRHYDYPRDL
jgi:predicted nuclease of predicted toxin-antitoxin system